MIVNYDRQTFIVQAPDEVIKIGMKIVPFHLIAPLL
jgi:hypothetical protein